MCLLDPDKDRELLVVCAYLTQIKMEDCRLYVYLTQITMDGCRLNVPT